MAFSTRRRARSAERLGVSSADLPCSTALSTAASSDGSCSSRYSATCSSLARRSNGRTRYWRISAARAMYAAIRTPVIACGENRAPCMMYAPTINAATSAASTMAAPRRASLSRHRARTRRMTPSRVSWADVNSIVLAMSLSRLTWNRDPPRHLVGEHRLRHQQQQHRSQQVPPEPLPPFNVHRGRRLGAGRRISRRPGDHCARQQLWLDRCQVRLGEVDVYRHHARLTARPHTLHLVEPLLSQLYRSPCRPGQPRPLARRRDRDVLDLARHTRRTSAVPKDARQIRDLTDDAPGPFVSIRRRVLGELVRHRQEYRLQRQVVPDPVERRGEHNHPPPANFALEQRDMTIIEARQLFVPGSRCNAAVPEEPRGREIARTRRAEHLEDGVTAIDVAERPAAVRRAVDGRVSRGWQELRRVRRTLARRAAIPQRDQQPAPIVHVLDETTPKLATRQIGIIDEDERPVHEVRRRH